MDTQSRLASLSLLAATITLLTGCAGLRDPVTATPPLGSERGSVAARDPGSGPAVLTYLSSSRSPEELARFGEIAPNVRFLCGLSGEEALARAGEIHAADAHVLGEELLAAASELCWVQAWSAGVDRYLALEGLRESDRIVFTNMKGMHGPVIAEHVFALLLALTRDLPAFHAAQRESRWDRRAGSRMTSLAGKTMLVAGMGGIGGEIARRAHGFDMRVLATVRTPRPASEWCDRLGTAEDLDAFLPEADVVAIALPLTPETEGLFDAARLALMKGGAILVNIGRGRIVDTDALLAALDSGHLGGACLDVTDPEPLPPDHPLWRQERVLITPHTSSHAELTGERRQALFEENLRRFSRGEPLLNVVDRRAGY